MSDDFRAEPNAFVGVFPVAWGFDNDELLSQTHQQNWQEKATYATEPVDGDEEVLGRGSVEIFDAAGLAGRADIIVEPPISELVHLVGTSKEPYTPTEAILLKEHKAVWRIVVSPEADAGPRASIAAGRLFGRIASTMIEAGAGGLMLPAAVTLHSPRMIQMVTMDLSRPDALANLFVGAWHDDGWMATRGLTSFGLPELETPVDEGLNGAYFRLMDLSASMIAQSGPFPTGSRVTIGPRTFTLGEGRQGPDDEQVPVAGTYGVLTIEP